MFFVHCVSVQDELGEGTDSTCNGTSRHEGSVETGICKRLIYVDLNPKDLIDSAKVSAEALGSM